MADEQKMSRRLLTRCALLGLGGLVAVASRGLHQAFLGGITTGPQGSHQATQLPGAEPGLGGLPQAARSLPVAANATGSWAAPVAMLALGAVAALTLQSRDESRTAMCSKHDRRTFRGKLHGHTFGKYRLRNNKARRIQKIKNGTFDPATVVQQGQPEPEHCWDMDNLLQNKMFYFPQYFRDVYEDWRSDQVEFERSRWKEWRGIKGPQSAFKNWTPPGMEPPPEAPPEPTPDPTPKPPASPKEDKKSKKAPTADADKATESKEAAAPAAPEPEASKEPVEPAAEESKAPDKKAELEAPAEEPKEAAPKKSEAAPAEPKAPAEEPKEPEAPAAAPKEPEAAAAKPEAPAEEPKEPEAPAAAPKEPEAAAAEPEAPAEEPKEPEAPAAAPKEPEAAAAEPEVPAEEPKEPEAPAAAPKEPEAAASAPASSSDEGKPKAASGAKAVKALRERSRAGILDCQKALKETDGDMDKAMEWLKKKGMAKADKKAGNIAVEGNISSYVHFNNKIAVLVEVNSETDFVASNAIFKEFTNDVAMQIAANATVNVITVDDVPAELMEKERALEMQKEDLEGKPDQVKGKIVEGRLKKKFDETALMNQKWLKDEEMTVQQALKATIAKLGENLVIRRFVRLNLGEGLEKKDTDFAAGVEKELAKYKKSGEEPAPENKEPEAPKEVAPEPAKAEEKPKVQVSAAQVKELRQRSGAGILDSKKALAETGGDVDKAMEWLKKKGMAKADKKAGNLSVEGVVASYVHFNQKLGVIVEINSETDFVAMNAIFKEFAQDVAMQIAAIPSIQFVSIDDVPAESYNKEKELEMAKEDLAGKPDNIKEKIVEGRLKKKFEENALLGQKWLKDEEKTVQEVLKEKIAKLGENIVIRRFERLNLGEGLEKKDADFAAGVEQELAKYRS